MVGNDEFAENVRLRLGEFLQLAHVPIEGDHGRAADGLTVRGLDRAPDNQRSVIIKCPDGFQQLVELGGGRVLNNAAQVVPQALLDLEVHDELLSGFGKLRLVALLLETLGQFLQLIECGTVGRIERLDDLPFEQRKKCVLQIADRRAAIAELQRWNNNVHEVGVPGRAIVGVRGGTLEIGSRRSVCLVWGGTGKYVN